MVLTGPPSLDGMLLLGSNLYWIVTGTGIQSVPTSGGTTKTVYPSTDINKMLGTDGTSLYFTTTTGTGSTVESVAPDGTNDTVLASGAYDFLASDGGPQIFVVNETVYVGGAVNGQEILAVPKAGGTAVGLLPDTAPIIQALLWADTSGIYVSTPDSVDYMPLTGSTLTAVQTFGINGEPAPGTLTVVNGTAYYIAGSGSAATLMKSDAGAPATTVMSYSGVSALRAGLMSDGNGGLIALLGGGVYSVDATSGAYTAIDSNILNMDGQEHALDANHIYYATVSNSVFSIWSTAR